MFFLRILIDLEKRLFIKINLIRKFLKNIYLTVD